MGNWVPIASVIVSIIAAYSAIKTSRTSANATTVNARTNAETEAYTRARKLDVETITRQDAEIKELYEKLEHLNNDVKMVHSENEVLRVDNARILAENARLRDLNESVLADNRGLKGEVTALRQRFTRIERGLHPDSTEPIRERSTDTSPMKIVEIEDYGGE